VNLPELRLDDLKPKDRSPQIDLSILMTIYGHRQAQMARTLETLARQTWRNFEVMIAHSKNLTGMSEIVNIFSPFLNLRTFPVSPYSSKQYCPTLGFKTMFPEARGKVIAIMQPEVMLRKDAAKALYFNHFEEMKDTLYWRMNLSHYSKVGRPRFVNFKVGFFSQFGTNTLDGLDWHSDMNNVENYEFWNHRECFSDSWNSHMLSYYEFPWWFVSSALADDPIWKDMPIFEGHASIDMWLLAYRRIHNYVEASPLRFMGYHQRHKVTATAPPSEADLTGTIPSADSSSWEPMGRLELVNECVQYGIVGLTGHEEEELLRKYLLKAKSHTLTMTEQHRAMGVSSRNPPELPMPWNLIARDL
jgi:hypothetical protein